MTDEEKESWENSYEQDGEVYRLTVTDKKQLEELDDTLLLPLLMNYQMSSVDEQTFKESVAKQTGMDQAMLDNMSIEQIGESMGVQNQNPNSVALATLHSAKGLEYENVYIIDVNEGVMPYKKAVLAIRPASLNTL